jgi:hypothetical protein
LPFRGLEEVVDVPDLVPEGIDSPEGFCAEMGYKPCEGHVDRPPAPGGDILRIERSGLRIPKKPTGYNGIMSPGIPGSCRPP